MKKYMTIENIGSIAVTIVVSITAVMVILDLCTWYEVRNETQGMFAMFLDSPWYSRIWNQNTMNQQINSCNIQTIELETRILVTLIAGGVTAVATSFLFTCFEDKLGSNKTGATTTTKTKAKEEEEEISDAK